jgi:P-type Cu2+ transporter
MNKNLCFHCGLNLINYDYSYYIDNEKKFFCCIGCMSIAKFIINNKFGEYYNVRSDFSTTQYNKKEINRLDFKIYDDFKYISKFIKIDNNDYNYIILSVNGITCSACTWLIERHLKKIIGINEIFINLITCRVKINWNRSLVNLSTIIEELYKIGYEAYPYNQKQLENVYYNEYKNELKRLVISGIGMAQVMMLSAALYIGENIDMNHIIWNFIRFIGLIITTPVLFFSAQNILKSAYKNFINYSFNMDTTISLSLIIAYVSSVFNLVNSSGEIYFDSICMFIFFLLLGRFLEMRVRHKSNDIINGLQEINSDIIELLYESKIKLITLDQVQINDKIIVKPGNVIPVDGLILEGESIVDESILTGESMPLYKTPGLLVIGGSTNIENSILIKATSTKGTSTIDIIISLLENAELNNDNKLIDIIAKYFVIIVIILTSIVSFFWFRYHPENFLNVLLSMLVISCPCALSLAIPVAIMSASNFLAKKGFFIIKKNTLENINNISDIVFDKTGTLTLNNFIIDKIILNSNENFKTILSIALCLEENSNHPISKAFLNISFERIEYSYDKNNIKNYINYGIEGVIENKYYRIGKSKFIKNWVSTYKKLKQHYDGNYIILASKNEILAWFFLKNPERSNIRHCIENIKFLGFKTHILSGDSFENVFNLVKKLDVDYFNYNTTVKDKVKYIKNLQNKNKKVMMIGDGINDAPALNSANISIAMGSGADLAKINSSAILLNNDFKIILKILFHSKKTNIIIKQNIMWAVCYNITGLFLAGGNLLSPYYAAIGMSLSSLIVVFNSLRLNNFK